MYCPVVKIANEVVEQIREHEDAEVSRIIAGLEWLSRNAFPTAEEQCMGIPPDRFLRALDGTDWLIGYDLRYPKGGESFASLWPHEVWVWFIGVQAEADAKLSTRRSA